MIDAAFVEQLVMESRGYGVVARFLDARYADEWEDVLQQSLLVLWMNRGQLRSAASGLAFYRGIVRRVARSYRRRKLDRVRYVAVRPWHAIDLCNGRSAAELRAQEIRQARARLYALLMLVAEKHRAAYRAWRRRGYRSETHAQQIEMSRLVEALRRAAGVAEAPRRRFRYCSRGKATRASCATQARKIVRRSRACM
jgi:DNA-directed RNA polymerase specialized sigma24 family protein